MSKKVTGWIKFNATSTSKCPVHSGTVVDVKFKNNIMYNGRAYHYDWTNTNLPIIAYRKSTKKNSVILSKKTGTITDYKLVLESEVKKMNKLGYKSNSTVSRTLAADTSERWPAENSIHGKTLEKVLPSEEATPRVDSIDMNSGTFFTPSGAYLAKLTQPLPERKEEPDESDFSWPSFVVGAIFTLIVIAVVLEGVR